MNVERSDDASLDDCEHVLERVYEFLDKNSMLLRVMRSATTWRCASRVWRDSMSRRR